MRPDQFQALLDYIDARIAEKIGDAFGQDTLRETIRKDEFLHELQEKLIEYPR